MFNFLVLNVCLLTRSTQVPYFLTELMFTDFAVIIRGPMTIATVFNVDQIFISWGLSKAAQGNSRKRFKHIV